MSRTQKILVRVERVEWVSLKTKGLYVKNKGNHIINQQLEVTSPITNMLRSLDQVVSTKGTVRCFDKQK